MFEKFAGAYDLGIVRRQLLGPMQILKRLVPAMQTPRAERTIDSRHRIVLHGEVSGPRAVFFRPMSLRFLESRDLFEDTQILRIGRQDFRPRLHGERGFSLLSREIASVFLEIWRWLFHDTLPFIESLFHHCEIALPEFRLDEAIPGPVILWLQFQDAARQIGCFVIGMFVQCLAQIGAERLFFFRCAVTSGKEKNSGNRHRHHDGAGLT